MALSTIDKLRRLEELEKVNSQITAQFQDLRDKLYTQELKDKLGRLYEKETNATKDIRYEIDTLAKEIQADVLVSQRSVIGEFLSCIFSKARETWDGKGLSGYAVAHPEINIFKKIGSPTATIRQTPRKKDTTQEVETPF